MAKQPKPATVETTLHNEIYHLAASFIAAFFIYLVSFNELLAIFTFLLGFFMDADHLVDYLSYLIKFKKPFVLKEFMSGTYFAEWKKFITPMHSYEIVIISFLLFLITANFLFLSITLAVLQHVVVDYYSNYVNMYAYSFIYRLKNKFVKASIRKDYSP